MSRSLIRHIAVHSLSMSLLFTIGLFAARAVEAEQPDLEKLVGQPADIASSAYQYRADRKADENPPESWLALMWYAGQPLNKPVDVQAPAIRQALCGLLWEEIRPIKTLELTWPADAKRRPAPEQLTVTTLNATCSASSWWNNLAPVKQTIKPTVSADGNTYVYDLRKDTCGIVVSVAGGKNASDYDVPTVRVLTADTWKKMDVEIEWGFDPSTAEKDYSGRIETYDGAVAGSAPARRRRQHHDHGCEHLAFRRQRFRPAGRETHSPIPGHVEMAAGATVHQPARRRRPNHRDAMDQGRQLLLPRRGPRKRPDPRARVRILRPSDVRANGS